MFMDESMLMILSHGHVDIEIMETYASSLVLFTTIFDLGLQSKKKE